MAVPHVREVHAAGFKGIKLHPYYQEFDVDEARLFPIYAEAQRLNLLVVCHTGFDIAFPRVDKGNAERIRRVIDLFPTLKFVTTHMGAWENWDEVRRFLLGRPVLMETSFSANVMDAAAMRGMLMAHPPEYVLFGSDSPWLDQGASIAALRELDLGADRERLLFYENARRLLDLPARP